MKKRHILILLLLSVMAVLILLPVIMTFLYSFFSPREISDFMKTRNNYGETLMEVKLYPRMFSMDQYWRVLIEDMSILRYYFNSILYTLAILLGQTVIIPALAYALSRFQFPGRDALSFLVIMLLLLPFQVTMVPTVLMLRNLGLMDTAWAIILPSIASPFYVFLLRQSMIGIPNELFEAAQMDGAGPIRCYFHNKHDEIKSMRTIIILDLQIVEICIVLDIIVVSLNRPSVFVTPRKSLCLKDFRRIEDMTKNHPLNLEPRRFLMAPDMRKPA